MYTNTHTTCTLKARASTRWRASPMCAKRAGSVTRADTSAPRPHGVASAWTSAESKDVR